MSFDRISLSETLLNWPQPVPSEQGSTPLLERIRHCLHMIQTQGVGFHDLLPLLRHFTLGEQSRTGKRAELRVPVLPGWPEVDLWHRHGFTIVDHDKNNRWVEVQEWHPPWLDYSSGGVFADAFSDKQVRQSSRIPADPFLRAATGFEFYSCPGQREAVRAAFLMRPGDTLMVNLPTGSGKSLVAHAPALHAGDGHLTLFVVPTVALAIDQAQQMKVMLEQQGRVAGPMVWRSGLGDQQRQEIRQAIRHGSQRILFTSPEALTTSLLGPVFEAARAGLIRYLVVDEAHLVTQWGDSFRPAFQALAGLRRGLLRAAGERPFRTLLLSATFTEETVATLSRLFGNEGCVEMVSAVHLRPEPQYWRHRATTPVQHQERILEAIRYAPRPLILYVNRPKEAEKWKSLLQAEGLTRVECFHGNTPNNTRETVIRAWRVDLLDIIVATSAFGVGIDKSDVRCIIHASIPETLDRFYQEVGRGGRNGKPSASLLIYDQAERHSHDRLATPTLITEKLGYNRWKALYANSQRKENSELLELDLGEVPEHSRGSSDYNAAWNMRTILLMERSGLIQLDLEPEALSIEEDTEAHHKVFVRVLHDGHMREETWEAHVSPSRAASHKSAWNNLQALQGWLSGKTEIATALKKLYTIRNSPWYTDVVSVCGGCPDHRRQQDHISHMPYRIPEPVPINKMVTSTMDGWRKKLPWLDPVFTTVFYQPDDSSSLLRFLEWLVGEGGIQEVAVDPHSPVVETRGFNKLFERAPERMLLQQSFERAPTLLAAMPLARASILGLDDASTSFDQALLLQRSFHVVLVPVGTTDPTNPERLLQDVQTNAVLLHDILPVIFQ